MFEYRIEKEKDRIIVFFHGDMDIDATELIEDEVTPKLLQGKEVVLDFAEVSFVDSSGISLIISMVNQLKEKSIHVGIINVQPEVKDVFSLLQLPKILGESIFEHQ